METKMQPFLFEGEALVRIVEVDGKPGFLSEDICQVLGIKNHRDALAKLDDDERVSVEVDTLGGRQSVAAVTEGGLYTLILRARDATKPGTVAHRFRKWVTNEVLPSIRRTGGYGKPAAAPDRHLTDEGDELTAPEDLKLRKVNTAIRCFGERVGCQLWVKLNLDWVPAMAHAVAQTDFLDRPFPPGSVTITVSPPPTPEGREAA